MKNENIVLKRKLILSPVKDCPFASEMVLNPAIIEDPKTGKIHMLIRTSGPYPHKRLEGKPLPYPIFLAYAWSEDGGETFDFDLTNPALAPMLKYEAEELLVRNGRGEFVPAYHNGCIEDPRLFFIEGECYLTVACRMFPPGPYWEHDEPSQCMPEWAKSEDSPYVSAENLTVTVLYKVDLAALSDKDYSAAFTFITSLTDPVRGQDRDVVIFPEKMMIDGKMQYVMLHRPVTPNKYDEFDEPLPSMVMSASPDLYSFAEKATRREIIYSPRLDWQANRVGASTPMLPLGNGEWLLSFHGKKDDVIGYTQSFMILKERENDFPEITHLYPKRWIVNEVDFEEPAKFGIPCVFFTGMIKLGEELLVSYGAADEVAAVMRLDYNKLLSILREYPYEK